MDVTIKLSSTVNKNVDLESFLTRIYQLHAGVGRTWDGLNVQLVLRKPVIVDRLADDRSAQ